MNQIPIKVSGDIPGDILSHILTITVKPQVENAIEYLAYIEEKTADEIKAEITGVEITAEKLGDNHYGIYGVFQYETGEKCTLPLIYVTGDEIKPANWRQMEDDGEWEY